jgi:hypothetical protein
MSAYGFKARFEAPLLAGTKLTTIRADRKDGRVPKVGGRFIAAMGMRTKKYRALFESTIEKVSRFQIEAVCGESEFEPMDYMICVDSNIMDRGEAETMAKADGFDGLDDFLRFFEAEHSIDTRGFKGWLIRWKPLTDGR